MQEYHKVWAPRTGSTPVELFGFRYDVGLDPIDVNLERMLSAFRRGCDDLREIWTLALRPDTLGKILSLGRASSDGSKFHLDDELWVRLIYEFATTYHQRPFERGHLLKSVTPLYLARVASFVIETQSMAAGEVEERIEGLCLAFENLKPYLLELWSGDAEDDRSRSAAANDPASRQSAPTQMEV
jgi:hypothetical protein